MKQVVLKPELRTPGGETVSIYLNDNWAGDVYLVYREGDVLTGTIQIDTKSVSEDDMELVTEEVRTYIEHLNAALGVEDSSVVMVYGDISSMIEMEPFEVLSVETVQEDDEIDAYEENLEFVDAFDEDEEEDCEDEDCEDEDVMEFDDLDIGSSIEFADDDEDDEIFYETDADEDDEAFHLSVAYRKGEHTKYHLHDDEHYTLGLVSVDEIGDNISGRVEFWERPDDEEANEVAKMLARTFGELGDAENISFTMNHADYHIGDMHLERRDFL
ncbi:hypothetical protein JJB07_12650 [Tumebacillus sp. ITR2]|uniref:DUF1292 domain-containing protein n=1 Tax=Tumebacillus amylolyticus TaxID=2801339 RepID=A0ABS1JB64_9BACL|nr:hypothetical protein [Tumebacillus amylolyticus]MBL0387503.1 hypothetical protein [Tumebacillus amylolyticus]